MTTQRTVTITTANLGRGGAPGEFQENLERLFDQVPGKHRFFGFQEIDEADAPEEMAAIKKVFGETHRFSGTKTRVPIAVPRTFEIVSRSVNKISNGVDELSPDRHVVKAVVAPVENADLKIAALNTHFARDASRLAGARAQAQAGLKEVVNRTQDAGMASFLTADLNSFDFPLLGRGEKRFVASRLDYIRAYPGDKGLPEMLLLKTGTVDLTIDGHNAHWARVRLIWS